VICAIEYAAFSGEKLVLLSALQLNTCTSLQNKVTTVKLECFHLVIETIKPNLCMLLLDSMALGWLKKRKKSNDNAKKKLETSLAVDERAFINPVWLESTIETPKPNFTARVLAIGPQLVMAVEHLLV
jgi:hypothetical protein